MTLVAVLAMAVLVLVGAKRLGVGAPQGPLELVGRLPLDARRAIYLVKVGPQVLVVGSSEAGLVKLGEVTGLELPPSAPPRTFSDVLRGARAPGAGGEARPAGPPSVSVRGEHAKA